MAGPRKKNTDKEPGREKKTPRRKEKERPSRSKRQKTESKELQTPEKGQTKLEFVTPKRPGTVRTISPSPAPRSKAREDQQNDDVARVRPDTRSKRASSSLPMALQLQERRNASIQQTNEQPTVSDQGKIAPNSSRYNIRTDPDGRLAPTAYSAASITKLTMELAQECGMDNATKVKHPLQIIDWVMSRETDEAIANGVTGLAQLLENRFLQSELLAEYAEIGLRSHRDFARVYQTFPTVRSAIAPISKRIEVAKKARTRMQDNIRTLTGYMGEAYFRQHFLDIMTPTLSDMLLNTLKFAYGHRVPMADVHTGLDKARRDRLTVKGKGIRSNIELQPSDVIHWLIGHYNQRQVTQADVKAINNRRLNVTTAPKFLSLDSSGHLQHNTTRNPAVKPPTIQGDETLYNSKGKELSREQVQKRIDEAIKRLTQQKGTLRSSKQLDQSETTLGEEQPDEHKLRRSDRLSELDAHSEGGKKSTIGISAIPRRPKPAASKHKKPRKEVIKIKGQPEGSNGLLDFTRGQRDADLEGIRSLSNSVEKIFEDIPVTTTSKPTFPSSSAEDISDHLVEQASGLENELLQYIIDSYRHINGQTGATQGIPDLLRNSRQGDVLQAVSRITHAVVAQQPQDGPHPVVSHSEWPWQEFAAIYTMMRTLQLVEARQDPAWVSYARSIRENMLSQYAGLEGTTIRIAGNVHQEDIALAPSAITEDAFFLDEAHPSRYTGWLDDNVVLNAVRFLTRHDADAQVMDPLLLSSFLDGHERHQANPDTIAIPPPPLVHDTNSRPVIYAPMHTGGNHWLLLVLNSRARTYAILNSIDSAAYTSAAGNAVTHLISSLFTNSGQWTEENIRSPQQENYADCGFWVAANAASYASRGVAAGRQQSSDLRLWLFRLLCQALEDATSGGAPRQWANEVQHTYITDFGRVQSSKQKKSIQEIEDVADDDLDGGLINLSPEILNILDDKDQVLSPLAEKEPGLQETPRIMLKLKLRGASNEKASEPKGKKRKLSEAAIDDTPSKRGRKTSTEDGDSSKKATKKVKSGSGKKK